MKFILASFFLFAVVGAWLYFYWDRPVVSFYGGGLVFNHSTSMRVHKLSTGSREFCVPKAYFVFSNSFHPGSGIGLDLSMELESLKPWNVYVDEINFYAREKKMSRVEIDKVRSREIDLKISERLEGGKSVDWKWKLFLKDIQIRDNGRFTQILPGKASVTQYDYHLVPRNASDYSYIISCISGARCELETFYDDSVVYSVSFDENYLGIVDAIESRARGLIKKFTCE
ncbi:hypothetical protein [Pseudomonas indica]|uniref:hypothetical protein n=1 Tax=Pseudomonas indica TaxID=137658 RepID=UPI003FD2F6DE